MESRDISFGIVLTGESSVHQLRSRQCSVVDKGVLVPLMAEVEAEDRQLVQHRQWLSRDHRDSRPRDRLVFLP